MQKVNTYFQTTITTLVVTGTTDLQVSEEIAKSNGELMIKPVKSSDLYLWLSH